MKIRFRLIAALLCFCMMLSMSSCMYMGRVFGVVGDMMLEIDQNGDDPDDGLGKSPLVYTLTEADLTHFTDLVNECRELVLAGTDTDAIEAAMIEMEDFYYHIVSQAQIAYLLYCKDMQDQQLTDDQLFASGMQSDAYGIYIEFCQAVDESNSPYREEFFSTWSEADLMSMRSYTDEVTALMQANDEISAEYHELDLESEDDLKKVAAFYLDFLENNQKQAKIMGSANYYEYANESMYLRDASKAEREAFRDYVAEYIVPLYVDLSADFEPLFSALSPGNQLKISNLLFKPYNQQSKDYVANYIATYPTDVQDSFNRMFDISSSLFTDGKNAYEGAYTTYLYDEGRPFCYFGPEYQGCFTIVHEMGHFYAGNFNALSDIQLDLAEVHSQANELLFLRYMKDNTPENVFRVLELYQVLTILGNIILGTIIDEFEEYVYTNYDSIKTKGTSLDQIMEDICENYGGKDTVYENVGDMSLYWKYVVIDSPVYYISYALSATAALSLYDISTRDVDSARETFLSLAEDLDIDLSFREMLEVAGLPDPYAESTMIAIRDCFS
ncbi:MAG: hypothetical protein E7666_01760 [Ruminococcaceae bacterium]|nr:hypothetical protein [Oscillospiraceae bacterium]